MTTRTRHDRTSVVRGGRILQILSTTPASLSTLATDGESQRFHHVGITRPVASGGRWSPRLSACSRGGVSVPPPSSARRRPWVSMLPKKKHWSNAKGDDVRHLSRRSSSSSCSRCSRACSDLGSASERAGEPMSRRSSSTGSRIAAASNRDVGGCERCCDACTACASTIVAPTRMGAHHRPDAKKSIRLCAWSFVIMLHVFAPLRTLVSG